MKTLKEAMKRERGDTEKERYADHSVGTAKQETCQRWGICGKF